MSAREMLRGVWGGAALGAVVGFGLWFFGVTWPFAVATGILFVAGAIAWVLYGGAERPLYPRAGVESRPGTRPDLIQIAWTLRGRGGVIADAGIKRLRAHAAHRLARHGWVLEDPAAAPQIRAALGKRAWATLTAPDGIRIAEVEHCLDALDTLDTTDTIGAPRP